MPNAPDSAVVQARFRPTEFPPAFDTFTAFFRTSERPPYDHELGVSARVIDDDARIHAQRTLRMKRGGRTHATLCFDSEAPGPALDIGLTLEHFYGGQHYGTLRLTYLIAYKSNPLVSLCNSARTDKGTEAYSGNGFPHCYAIDYHDLFAKHRDDAFALLEIGLDDASKESGRPADAPSLRVWRDYFPRATLYGYDINDFTVFNQERTITFQGDQGSRADLDRFIAQHGEPEFRIVIDDGSHASSHQQASLAALFRHVESGGMYIIEDLGWQPFPEAPKTLDVLLELRETGQIRSPFIPDTDARNLEQMVASVEIRQPNDSPFAVIHKKRGPLRK
jgi:hypothetical protein